MSARANEIVIERERGEVVARMNLKDAVLDGHCEWYDGWGNLIACGSFKDGVPFTGIFLNWTNFFGHLRKEDPYDPTVYCQDWITMFESSFDSEPPKYELVLEAHYKGQKLSLNQSNQSMK